MSLPISFVSTRPQLRVQWDGRAAHPFAALFTLSNHGLQAINDNGGAGDHQIPSTVVRFDKKYYAELVMTKVDAAGILGLGISVNKLVFSFTNTYYISSVGRTFFNGTVVDRGLTYNDGDVVRLAIDFNTGNLWLSKNATWIGAGADPATGANPLGTGLSGQFYLIAKAASSNNNMTAGIRGKSADFTFGIPSGFIAWEGW